LHPGEIFVHPVTGFQVCSVHSIFDRVAIRRYQCCWGPNYACQSINRGFMFSVCTVTSGRLLALLSLLGVSGRKSLCLAAPGARSGRLTEKLGDFPLQHRNPQIGSRWRAELLHGTMCRHPIIYPLVVIQLSRESGYHSEDIAGGISLTAMSCLAIHQIGKCSGLKR
jgi:hypothetical protein